jgi:anaerobic magnesium-protoporphyrin IX monomethyl ester cyclase
MKILLLNPPTRNSKKFIREGRCTQEQGVWATLWPPISLVMIGAVLEKDEHVVRIIDCPAEGVSWEDLGEEIRKFSPNLVTWSTGTPSIGNDLSLASDIKEMDSAILTAVFGTHVTVLDKQCMAEFPCVDFIIRNEPEMTARELVNVLEETRSLEAVAGITFRDHNGENISKS